MKNPWLIIGVVAVALIGGAIWYGNVSAEKNNEGITLVPHIKGNPDATVKLVEYSDFQCPACASFQPVVADMLELYGDQVSFEYKHFPLPIHPWAEMAARAAEAAGQQGKFFEYHDKLFVEQKSWAQAGNPTGAFVRYAEELGLDMEKFKRHFKASKIRDKVRADLNEARGLNLTGTPSFFLNGQQMQIQTFEDFLGQIEAQVNPAGVGVTTEEGTSATPSVRFGI